MLIYLFQTVGSLATTLGYERQLKPTLTDRLLNQSWYNPKGYNYTDFDETNATTTVYYLRLASQPTRPY